MSVYESERRRSTRDFIKYARALQLKSLSYTSQFPEKYADMARYINNLAFEVHDQAKRAEGYPDNFVQDLVQIRIYLLSSRAALTSLISQVDLAYELFPLSGYSYTNRRNNDEESDQKIEVASLKDLNKSTKILRDWSASLFDALTALDEAIKHIEGRISCP